MTTAQADCSVLHDASEKFADVVVQAIAVVPDETVAPPDGSAAQRVLRFEVIHTGASCPIDMADACLVITAVDPAVRFVAPGPDERGNYVSYWETAVGPAPIPRWQPMSDGAVISTPNICIASQTLPSDIGTGEGAGYLHYTPGRHGDGWTVAVGVRHEQDVNQLTNLALTITVSARPDWTPRTNDLSVLIAEH